VPTLTSAVSDGSPYVEADVTLVKAQLMLDRCKRLLATVLTASLLTASSAAVATDLDPAAQVDPFIGTQDIAAFQDGGGAIPGATVPAGMLYWSPDVPYQTGFGARYRPEAGRIRGFSLTHLSGEACGALGDVGILPIIGRPTMSPAVRSPKPRPRIVTGSEGAVPGQYSVTLEGGLSARLAAATRSGVGRFTFPDGAEPMLAFDLSRDLNTVIDAEATITRGEVSGHVRAGQFCGTENRYTLYFVLRPDRAIVARGTFDDHGVYPDGTTIAGAHVGGWIGFARGTREIDLRVGISYVSVAGARANLAAEIGGADEPTVAARARAQWNRALGKIEVEGGDPVRRRIFTTALYHALIHPATLSDADGTYRGFDEQLHRLAPGQVHYGDFSGWDVYRSQIPLIAMIDPERASAIAQSLVDDAEQGGGFPRWSIANDETNVMVGDPGAIVVAQADAFGAHAFDRRSALRLMLAGANDATAHSRLYLERPGLEQYLQRGYVFQDPDRPQEKTTENDNSASVTLEYAGADFAVARFAAALGDAANARALDRRSGNWRHLLDPTTGYLRARGANGAFLPGFSPGMIDGYVEGNAAQYNWMVPFDIEGLVEAIGGPAATTARLDAFFSKPVKNHYRGPEPYFTIANEHGFAVSWVYNWASSPARAQTIVRKTIDSFTDRPDGLPGNDDLGATSSWAVLAMLGLYPAIPGVGGVTMSTPVFPRAALHIGARTLVIEARGAPTLGYVRAITFDGRAVGRWWLDWAALSRGGLLRFELAPDPASAASLAPPPSFRSHR